MLTEQAGLDLLNSGARQFDASAVVLVQRLGGLPLALELAQHFLNLRPTLTIEQLLKEMDNLGDLEALSIFAEKYGDQLPSGHIKEVAATIRLSWELASPTAQKALQAISLLAPTAVPRRLLAKILELQGENVLLDPLEEALSDLAIKFSLVELDEESDPRVHRLIGGFVRNTLAEDDPLYPKTVDAVRAELSRVIDEQDALALRELEKVLPHGEILLTVDFVDAEEQVDIANYIGWQHENWGRYRLGGQFRRQALMIASANFEPGHPSLARSQSNLALVLKDLGQLEQARDLLQQALAAAEQTYDPGHPSLARSQSNLALVLKDLGQLEQARDLLQQALAAAEQTYDPGHPSLARSQSNLALVLKDLGQLEQARDWVKQAYETYLTRFGPDHPRTKIFAGNLRVIENVLEEG